MWVVQVRKDLMHLSKQYIHEIDALVLQTERNVLHLKKKKKKKKHRNSYIVVRKSLVYEASVSVGFKSGRREVGRWNERVRAKRCDAVDWERIKI